MAPVEDHLPLAEDHDRRQPAGLKLGAKLDDLARRPAQLPNLLCPRQALRRRAIRVLFDKEGDPPEAVSRRLVAPVVKGMGRVAVIMEPVVARRECQRPVAAPVLIVPRRLRFKGIHPPHDLAGRGVLHIAEIDHLRAPLLADGIEPQAGAGVQGKVDSLPGVVARLLDGGDDGPGGILVVARRQAGDRGQSLHDRQEHGVVQGLILARLGDQGHQVYAVDRLGQGDDTLPGAHVRIPDLVGIEIPGEAGRGVGTRAIGSHVQAQRGQPALHRFLGRRPGLEALD